MLKAWCRLAGMLLDEAGESYSNHGCNDWKWPAGWSLVEREALVTALWEDDRRKPVSQFHSDDLEAMENEINGEYGPGDHRLMRFFARQLKKMGEQ